MGGEEPIVEAGGPSRHLRELAEREAARLRGVRGKHSVVRRGRLTDRPSTWDAVALLT